MTAFGSRDTLQDARDHGAYDMLPNRSISITCCRPWSEPYSEAGESCTADAGTRNMDYSKPWIFEEIAKGCEEAYFRQKEIDLIEKRRRRFHEEQDRERLAEDVGVDDEQILRAFEELGFTRDTVTILHLVPLVQVAWSDGCMTEAKRAKILEMAALRAVTPATSGYLMLEKLLYTRPF
jgi:hypothetical protein